MKSEDILPYSVECAITNYPLVKELYDLVEDDYNLNDKGHQLEHVMQTMSTASWILSLLDIADKSLKNDPEYGYMFKEKYTLANEIEIQIAIAFHDMYARFKDDHEHRAASWVDNIAPVIRNICNKHCPGVVINLDNVTTAILEHRASAGGYDNFEPTEWKSPISEIVAVADCGCPVADIDVYLRAYQYACKHYDTEEERILHAYQHVKEKFGTFAFARRSKMFEWFYGKENATRERFVHDMTFAELKVQLPKRLQELHVNEVIRQLEKDYDGDEVSDEELESIGRNPDLTYKSKQQYKYKEVNTVHFNKEQYLRKLINHVVNRFTYEESKVAIINRELIRSNEWKLVYCSMDILNKELYTRPDQSPKLYLDRRFKDTNGEEFSIDMEVKNWDIPSFMELVKIMSENYVITRSFLTIKITEKAYFVNLYYGDSASDKTNLISELVISKQ